MCAYVKTEQETQRDRQRETDTRDRARKGHKKRKWYREGK